MRGRLSSSQLRQLRDGPFQEKDRFHALLCRVRDGGEICGSDVDASIEAKALMPSRESDSECTDANASVSDDDDSCHVWEF